MERLLTFIRTGTELYTPGDVALLCGISSAYVRLLIRKGLIPVERRTVRGGALLSRESVDAFCVARNARRVASGE